MVLTPKNGNITIGNEVDLEYRDHNTSTKAQLWRFQAVYTEDTQKELFSWGVFKNAESGLFLNALSSTSLTIEQGNFKS